MAHQCNRLIHCHKQISLSRILHCSLDCNHPVCRPYHPNEEKKKIKYGQLSFDLSCFDWPHVQAFDSCGFDHLSYKCSLPYQIIGPAFSPRRDLMMIILSFLFAVETHQYLYLDVSLPPHTQFRMGKNLSLAHPPTVSYELANQERDSRGGSSFVCAHSARDQRTCNPADIRIVRLSKRMCWLALSLLVVLHPINCN